jgi:hypothetical protein
MRGPLRHWPALAQQQQADAGRIFARPADAAGSGPPRLRPGLNKPPPRLPYPPRPARPGAGPNPRSSVDVDIKSDASPVTVADREAETAMRALIKAAFPEHGVFGEEHGLELGSGGGGDWLWVLDPIDGTKSFITGAPGRAGAGRGGAGVGRGGPGRAGAAAACFSVGSQGAAEPFSRAPARRAAPPGEGIDSGQAHTPASQPRPARRRQAARARRAPPRPVPPNR